MKLGVLGGSFNPIHYGHLLIAQSAFENLKLDKVLFLPTGKAPHKSLELDPKIRYEMTKLAISDNESFFISDIEILKTGYSYTVDTINELKDRFSCSKIYFIIGADSLFQIETWHNYEKLLETTDFAVANRVYNNKHSSERLNVRIKELQQKYNAKFKVFDTNIYEFSSTEIRKRTKDDQSIRYMVPENVRSYILKNGLYR
ncbi:MAG: nicotinate-nucleotide adenylyltransferase [Tissierellia bacterium]|nr:nicotinate-nucleotide adenylyltransferase [Tissierellia bacterium]